MFRKVNISSRFDGFFVIIVLVLLSLGCSTKASVPVTPTPTFSKFLPPTWTATVTLTSTITKTLTHTVTSTLTPTITQTLPPSLTPLPTIHFDELAWRSEVLLATNGGCRLPCFWGLTPGKTTVAELNQFFDQFPQDFVSGQDRKSTLFYLTFRTGDSSWSVSFWTDAQKLTSILLPVETAQYSFPLAKILSDYGMPEKVFIGPPQEFEHDLVMVVLYEKQQFAGRYILWQNELDKKLYCYDPQSIAQYVITWAPGREWLNPMEQKKELLKPLDEVSGFDIPSFHEVLKNYNRALCMKIQTDKILP